MSPWSPPRSVVPADAMIELRRRWDRLATEHEPVVRVLEPDAGLVPGEESVGIAPALQAVVAALPGVALGPIVVDYPQGASQTWPQLGDRLTHQPVWVDGREAVAVRITESGEAGQVVHVRDDGGLDVLADDVVAWWARLTGWAEKRLRELTLEIQQVAVDDEEAQLLLEEALEQEYADWLEEPEG